MASSSCDSDEEICWWKTKNLISERLIDGSLIHTLKRARKLQKETKQINISLRNYVKRKLRERRESLNSTNKHKNTSAYDNYITDSESSGVDDVFMVNSKPSTSARPHNNHPATSKHSSNKANLKSKTKVTIVLKDIPGNSKKTGKIKRQNSPPKAINENHNPNRSTNTNKILRSTKQRRQASSLTSANQENTLSHEVNNPLSERPSFTPPIDKINGVINGKNNKNGLTNSNEEIKHTLNSIKSNIISEEITDPVRRLPKGPATIKKNLFNTVRNAESDVHESQEIISRDSERFVNQDKDEYNSTSTLYEYPSMFNDDTGLSRNDTLSSDDIKSWTIDTTCDFTNDSRAGSIVSNELTTHDNTLSEIEKTGTAMNTSKTNEHTKNDSIVSVQPEAENSTLNNNNDIKIKEINILNESKDSEDTSIVIKRLPDNNSLKRGSFHENDSIKENSDLRLKKSNFNTSDRNDLPKKLNSSMKFQEKKAESFKAELLNDIKNSAPVSKNVEQNSLEEMKSPTHSLSLSRCGSISGDDSIRTRFVPKVKSTKIVNTRYKIVKLPEESKDGSFLHPLMTSSPNPKSLCVKNKTANEISKEPDKKLEDPKCIIKTQDNPNVSEGLDGSHLEERNNSHSAVNINHPRKIYDSYQENSECSNCGEAELPMEGRLSNFKTSSQSQDLSSKGKEHFTYPKTHSRKLLCEEGSPLQQEEEDRTNQRNSSSLDQVNEVLKTEVTSDQEIEDDFNVSPTHLSNSNQILSSTVTEIQSLRCVMQTLNTRKEKCDVDFLKEYEDQFLRKRAQQSSSESINTVGDRRPVKIQDLMAQSHFTEEAAAASLTMNDISDDDEIFIFEIPKTVDVQNFRDKKFMFEGDNEIIIGGKKFEVYESENRPMSIVLNKGDLKRSYGAVNLKAVRSVYIRPKMLKKEIEVRRIKREEEEPRSSTVPFPKNLRLRHPLLGSSIIANEISVSQKNNEMGVTSKKILKWLASQDQRDDEDPVNHGQCTGEEVKPRKEITDQEDKNVAMRNEVSYDDLELSRKKQRLKLTNDKHKFKDSEMQFNCMEDEKVKEETFIKDSPRKKRNIVFSDTFDETVTTNDDVSSIEIKLKKKMLKKKKQERVDKLKWDDEFDSKTLKRKSSISWTESDSDIQKKKSKVSLEFSKDNILTYGKDELVKSAAKMKLDNKMEIRGKQSQMDKEALKDEINMLELEASEENDKRKIRKHKKHNKGKGIDDFDVSRESQECVSLPVRINEEFAFSTSRASEEEQKRSESSHKEKLSFIKKVKRKIQLEKPALSKSGVEKLNVTHESSHEEDQSCKSSKNKKKHIYLKDVLQLSYPPKVIPSLSPKRRCRSFSNFESDIESKSSIRKRKKSKLNLTDVDDSEKEHELMNLEKFIIPHRRPILKKYKDQKL